VSRITSGPPLARVAGENMFLHGAPSAIGGFCSHSLIKGPESFELVLVVFENNLYLTYGGGVGLGGRHPL